VICVVDASVAVNWFARGDWARGEGDLDAASRLLQAVADDRVDLYPPPHFMAEVAAVLCRVTPSTAARDTEDLALLDITWAAPDVARLQAIDLAIRLKHHLFDTLYHALALSVPGAMMITADRRYFDKARSLGQIAWLADFTPA
jgi:predicted nucleic acid-binding protein